MEVIKTNVWSAGPGCHGGCGVLVYIKDGRVVKVEGDPDHPWNQGRLCPRCLALVQYIYHPQRILYPLKRVGERGENKWQRISWEEAFDIIEKKFKEIAEKYGPESVLFCQGTGRDIGGWISILAYSYGSPNWTMLGFSGNACYTPRLVAMWTVVGDFVVADTSQWLEKRYDDPEFTPPKYIVVWGQSLPSTCPDGFFSHWIVDLMKRGSKLIVIDPRVTWLASRAELHLQLRPGTDGALALGMLNVIISEGLYDKEFVEKWTNAPFLVRTDTNKLLRESDIKQDGDRFNFVVWDASRNAPAVWNSYMLAYDPEDAKPALEGYYEVELVDGSKVKCKTVWTALKERVSEYPPEKVAEITWVPKEDIIKAARLYATNKPSSIHWGLPIDQSSAATPAAHAITLLWCITGNLDIPGGNVIARYAFDVATYPYHSGRVAIKLPEEAHNKRSGAWKYPLVMRSRALSSPDTVLEQIFTGKPYPIKGAWIQTNNALAGMAAEPQKWHEALKKLEFVVVVDLFMTPTAVACADIVLPAATFLEKDSVRSWWTPLEAIKKVITVGECKGDPEINIELAKRFKPDFPWKNVEEYLDDALKPAGMTFKELCEKVWVMPPKGHSTRPYRRYENGLLRPDGRPGFLTLSSKLELWASFLEWAGLDPLPYYEEPPFSPYSTPELFKEYPLILSTGRRSSVLFHAEHRQIPWLREIDPDPVLEINPETAERLGIKDGDWVYVENMFGKCKRKALVTPIVPPWMVMAPHGWWLPEKEGAEPKLFAVWDVNINQLIPMGYCGRSGHGAPYKCMICRVYKAEGPP